VPTAGTYYLWSRVLAPDTTNNSYYVQVDGGCAINVGDNSSIAAGSWTWVNYQDGSTTARTSMTLTAGSHQVVMTGREPGVGVDRVLLLGDPSCVPAGTGGNCTPAPDTTLPTVSISAPTNGATVSGTTTISANASDNVAVGNVQFKLDGANLGAPDTTSPYSYAWDTTKIANGSHTLSAIAIDTSGNGATATSVTVTVNNPDTQPPSTPTGLTASAPTSAKVNLSWAASTDNVGVISYKIYRNGGSTPLASVTAPTTSYADAAVSASTTYSYTVTAIDVAGNQSPKSSVVSVTTPAAADTIPPSVPTGLAGTATGPNSTSITWNAATDSGGSGLAGYHLYRGTTATNLSLIASPPTTAYADTGLSASTTYYYAVSAYDNAANGSNASSPISVATSSSSDTTPPTAATNLHATAIGTNSVSLAWSASTDNVGVAGYRIWRGDGNWSNWVAVGNVGASTLTLTNSGLTPNTAYSYGVRAYDAAGNIASSSNIILVTTLLQTSDTIPPSAPTSLAAVAVSSSQINLSWTASTDNVGVTGYRIFRNGSTTPIAIVTSTSYGDSGLNASSTYLYTVDAIDAEGNHSALSNVVTASTPAQPTAVTVIGVVSSAANGQPIVGAYVHTGIRGTKTGAASSYTNSLGQYVLTGISANTKHNYYYSASGYKSQSYSWAFPAGLATENIKL